MIDIKVPTVGESISEVTLLKWTKNDGDYVERDEVIAELESEKATFEVNAEKAGIIKLEDIKEGDSIKIGDKLASIDGHRFTNFTESNGLSHNLVNDVIETPGGEMYVAMNNGTVDLISDDRVKQKEY